MLQEMDIKLEPMSELELTEYQTSAPAVYAESLKEGGVYPDEECLKIARESFKKHLPEGVRTPGHTFFVVKKVSSETSRPQVGTSNEIRIGSVWLGIREEQGKKSAYIYDIFLDEPFRGQGFGRLTLEKIEEAVNQLGLNRIGLHVFGHNLHARALYEKMGYQTKSIVMEKVLA